MLKKEIWGKGRKIRRFGRDVTIGPRERARPPALWRWSESGNPVRTKSTAVKRGPGVWYSKESKSEHPHRGGQRGLGSERAPSREPELAGDKTQHREGCPRNVVSTVTAPTGDRVKEVSKEGDISTEVNLGHRRSRRSLKNYLR